MRISQRANNSQRSRYVASKPAGSNRHSGFTLIELLIGLALGTVLIGGMISVFAGTKKTASVSEAMVEMQQSARFALEELARDIRMAGFQGCVDQKTSSANMIADKRPTNDLASTSIMGSQITSAGLMDPPGPLTFNLPAAPVTAVPGTHALTVQFGSQETLRIEPMDNTRAPVVLEDGSERFATGDLVMISNCQVADVFEVSGSLGGSLQHDPSVNSGLAELSAEYGTGGDTNRPRVMRFESNVYFVADTGRLASDGSQIRALYKQSLPYAMPALEIIEGVELFRLRFGIRAENEDDITFVTPTQINGLEHQIVSVQIGMLMSSINALAEQNDGNIYLLAGKPISAGNSVDTHAGDRRMRMAFNTTVKIRNRR